MAWEKQVVTVFERLISSTKLDQLFFVIRCGTVPWGHYGMSRSDHTSIVKGAENPGVFTGVIDLGQTRDLWGSVMSLMGGHDRSHSILGSSSHCVVSMIIHTKQLRHKNVSYYCFHAMIITELCYRCFSQNRQKVNQNAFSLLCIEYNLLASLTPTMIEYWFPQQLI